MSRQWLHVLCVCVCRAPVVLRVARVVRGRARQPRAAAGPRVAAPQARQQAAHQPARPRRGEDTNTIHIHFVLSKFYDFYRCP